MIKVLLIVIDNGKYYGNSKGMIFSESIDNHQVMGNDWNIADD